MAGQGVIGHGDDAVAHGKSRPCGGRVGGDPYDDRGGRLAGVLPRADSPAAPRVGGPSLGHGLEPGAGGVGFGPTFGSEGGRRARIVGDGRHEAQRQSGHRLDALEVHQMDVVARAVVLVVESGVKHHGGDASLDEGEMIGVVGDVPVEDEFESGRVARSLVRGDNRPPQTFRGAGAKNLEPPATQPADHVEVYRERDPEMGQGRRACPQEVVRPQQSFLLAIPEGEEDRAAEPFGEMVHRLGQLEEPGDAGGVVVGSVVDVAERTVAVVGVAVADVVEVCSDHDEFPGQDGVAATEDRHYVAHPAERLVESAVVTGRFEREPRQLVDHVGRRRPAAAGATLAPLEGVVGEGGHVATGVGAADRGMRCRHPLGGDDRAGGHQCQKQPRGRPKRRPSRGRRRSAIQLAREHGYLAAR